MSDELTHRMLRLLVPMVFALYLLWISLKQKRETPALLAVLLVILSIVGFNMKSEADTQQTDNCSSLFLASGATIPLSVPRSIAERVRSDLAKLPERIQRPVAHCFDQEASRVWLDAVRGACKQLPEGTPLSDPKVTAEAHELVEEWSAQGRGLKALCLAELRQERVPGLPPTPRRIPAEVSRGTWAEAGQHRETHGLRDHDADRNHGEARER